MKAVDFVKYVKLFGQIMKTWLVIYEFRGYNCRRVGPTQVELIFFVKKII